MAGRRRRQAGRSGASVSFGNSASSSPLLYDCTCLKLAAYNFARSPGQVRAARAEDITVILVHECDPMLGGCEFGSLFKTTPQDLISDGLYARIAVAFHTGQHRAVSLCMLAREINAVNYNSIHKFCMEAKLRLTGSASRNRSTSKMVTQFSEAEHGRASFRSPAQPFEDPPNEQEGQESDPPPGVEDPSDHLNEERAAQRAPTLWIAQRQR